MLSGDTGAAVGRRIRRLAVLAGMLTMAGAAGPALARALAGDEVTTFSRVRFPADVKLPLEISVGAVLVDFARINAREETFDIQGYLNLSWRVPSLAGKGNRRMFREDLWAPNIDFVNAVEPVKVQNEVNFHVSNDGVVDERVRFSGRFSSSLDLRRFPLDEQHLEVHVEPFSRNVNEIIFRVNPARVGRYDDAFLSDWELGPVRARISTTRHAAIEESRSRFTMDIEIHRRSTFYIWRVLVPLVLVVVASWGVFWVDPTQLQPQISTAVAVLISIVVFNITIDFALPKVAYFTFVDAHALVSYLFMLTSIGAIFLIHHRLNHRGLDAAKVLQRRARRLIPSAYLVVFALEVLNYWVIGSEPPRPAVITPPGASARSAPAPSSAPAPAPGPATPETL